MATRCSDSLSARTSGCAALLLRVSSWRTVSAAGFPAGRHRQRFLQLLVCLRSAFVEIGERRLLAQGVGPLCSVLRIF